MDREDRSAKFWIDSVSLARNFGIGAVELRRIQSTLAVALMDGRTIVVPITWYPRLLNASPDQRTRWQISGGGYGIHWPELDEDLSTEGLLRGAPAPGFAPVPAK